MSKHKIDIKERAIHWVTHHPWLKIISFILAIMVWFYVRGEISRFNY